MIINDQSIFISLAAGGVMGVLSVLNQALVSRRAGKSMLGNVLDFAFAILICGVTFILAIPLNFGRIRFMQVMLEGIGFASSVFVLGAPVQKVSRLIRKKIKQIGEQRRKIYKMRCFKMKKQTKSQKNIKKSQKT